MAVQLTVDIIAVTKSGKLLLIKRAKPPFMNKLVLPGGKVEENDKSLKHTAARELMEEAGLEIDPERMVFLTKLDQPNRDPRGRWESTVFVVQLSEQELSSTKAGSDAKEIVVREMSSLTEEKIGFDHFTAIKMWQEKVQ